MSNLLDFQHKISENELVSVVYNIATAELNPKFVNTKEINSSSESFDFNKYTQKNLRDFINKKSKLLTKNGDFIKGVRKNNKVTLTVLKELE